VDIDLDARIDLVLVMEQRWIVCSFL